MENKLSIVEDLPVKQKGSRYATYFGQMVDTIIAENAVAKYVDITESYAGVLGGRTSDVSFYLNINVVQSTDYVAATKRAAKKVMIEKGLKEFEIRKHENKFYMKINK